MVFNPVFFETNESSDLSYFARPQKISNANYLFADIMNVYSKKGGQVAPGFGKPEGMQSNEKGKLPVWAGELKSEEILKLTKELSNLFAGGNFTDLLKSNTQKTITKEQLINLLGEIKNLLSKGKNAGFDLSGIFEVLQQGVTEGKEIKLLFDDGANGVSVKIVKTQNSESLSAQNEKSTDNFIIKINQLITNQNNSQIQVKKTQELNTKITDNKKVDRKISSGLFAIALANIPENEIADSQVVLNKLTSINNFERLLKESVSSINGKNNEPVSKTELGVIIKKLSNFIKSIKTEISSSDKKVDEKVDNINVLIQNIANYIQSQPQNKFTEKLADELIRFSNEMAKIKNVSEIKVNTNENGEILDAKANAKLSSAVSEMATELSKVEKTGQSEPTKNISELKAKVSELQNLINSLKQESGEVSKVVAKSSEPIKQTITKDKVAQTVNAVSEKVTKLSSAVSEIVTELSKVEKAEQSEPTKNISELKAKVSKLQTLINSLKQESEEVRKVVAKSSEPIKQTITKGKVSQTVNAVSEKVTKLGSAVSEIVTELSIVEKTGQSEPTKNIPELKAKVSKLQTYVITKVTSNHKEFVNLEKSAPSLVNAEKKNQSSNSIPNQVRSEDQKAIKEIDRLLVKINSSSINGQELKSSLNDLYNKVEKVTVSDNAEATKLTKSIKSEIKKIVKGKITFARKTLAVKKITTLVRKFSDSLIPKEIGEKGINKLSVTDKTYQNVEVVNFEKEVKKAVTKLESKFVSAILEEKNNRKTNEKLSATVDKAENAKGKSNGTTSYNENSVKSKTENKSTAQDGSNNNNSSPDSKANTGAQVEHVAENNKEPKFSEKLNSINVTHNNITGRSFDAVKTTVGELATTTITKEDLINKFSEIVKSAKEKSITLQLKPVELGKIKVTLAVMHNDSVKANIQVENNVIKQFVENNISQLYSQLGKAGLQFSSVNVSVSQNPFAKESRYGNSGHKKQKGGNSFNGNIPIEEENKKTREFGYNTYEYLV